ncbi:phox-associated domain protein [Rhodotorula toruloides]|uniref:Phox-associated domain protein n=1 Tax=Rhodotorula toruloides TaxID=5286 RepID=A0A511KJS3_RHOTO|nr:phox-associated domain protein [Rhodotorula toruloides]
MAALRSVPPRKRGPPISTTILTDVDRAAAQPLHRRILFPSASSADSPRILHSSAHEALDPIILDLIALSLRAYVTPWYNGAISRDPDKEFLQAVTAVLVHVIQALEVRLTAVNWSGVLLAELPDLLACHYRDWDSAVERAGGGTAHNLSVDEMFHHLQPHIASRLRPAVEGETTARHCVTSEVDRVYLRALVDGLLKLILPPEDYRSETERAIVREIVVGVVFGTVFCRVAQPWFLHGLIAKQLEAREVERVVAEKTRAVDRQPAGTGVVDKAFAALLSLPLLFTSLASNFSASSVPGRTTSSQPPIHQSLLTLLLAVLPSSAFLSQIVYLVSLPVAFFSSRVDSLLANSVASHVCTASTAKICLEGAIKGMFPNDGWPAPKEDDPDEDAQDDLRRRCEEALARALPHSLPPLLFSRLPSEPPDPRIHLARHLLRPLVSHTANVHLFLSIVDLVVGKVFPELIVAPED